VRVNTFIFLSKEVFVNLHTKVKRIRGAEIQK